MNKQTAPKCAKCGYTIWEYNLPDYIDYSFDINKKTFYFCCPIHMDDWIKKQGPKLKSKDIERIKREDFLKQWKTIKKHNKDEIINVMLKNGGNIWTKECSPENSDVSFMSTGGWGKGNKYNHILVTIPYTEIHTIYSCAHWR